MDLKAPDIIVRNWKKNASRICRCTIWQW
jgi:hypothetical protein